MLLKPSTFLYMDTDRVSKLVKAWNTRKYEGEN